MKKAGYIILLCILFLQAGGLLFVCKVEQLIVQQQMHKQLRHEKEGFEKLILSVREYKKSRIGHDEIRIGDHLFDVKSVKIRGNSAELILKRDRREEKILAQIHRLSEPRKRRDTAIPRLIKQLISMRYLPNASGSDAISHSFDLYLYPPVHSRLISADRELSTPPPRMG